MKTTMSALLFAAVSVLPQIGSAQTPYIQFRANVPVAFQTSRASMDQGAYEVRLDRTSAGSPVVLFRNVETGKSSLAFAMQSTGKAADGKAYVRFACVSDSKCHVAQIDANGSKWVFTAPRMSAEEKLRLYSVSVPLAATRNSD